MEDSKQRGQLAQRSLDSFGENSDCVIAAGISEGVILIKTKGPTEDQDTLLTLIYGMLNPSETNNPNDDD